MEKPSGTRARTTPAPYKQVRGVIWGREVRTMRSTYPQPQNPPESGHKNDEGKHPLKEDTDMETKNTVVEAPVSRVSQEAFEAGINNSAGTESRTVERAPTWNEFTELRQRVAQMQKEAASAPAKSYAGMQGMLIGVGIGVGAGTAAGVYVGKQEGLTGDALVESASLGSAVGFWAGAASGWAVGKIVGHFANRKK